MLPLDYFDPSLFLYRETRSFSSFLSPSEKNKIQAANGGLLPPPEVLRLLLASPAGDLDDLLSHPRAAPAAVARLTAAFESGGTKALECERLPRLSWEEMRVVQAWREGMAIDEEEEETKALEGRERERPKELPPPAASSSALPPIPALDADDHASEPELDLDALDL